MKFKNWKITNKKLTGWTSNKREMTEERIYELKTDQEKLTNLKNREGKRLKNSPQSFNNLWINIKRSNLDIVVITEEERETETKKKYF